MKNILIIIFLTCSFSKIKAQNYTLQNCHSHNDYNHQTPFYDAYNLGFGSIEVDVFLINNELYVAHNKSDIDSTKTFQKLYLEPILTEIKKNNGKLKQPIQLIIDLKTGGETLKTIEDQLITYISIFKKAKVSFVISGEMPFPVEFKNYNEILQFDGRINTIYTKKELSRIALFSQNFQEIIKWNGKKQLDDDQQDLLVAFIKEIHKKGKKLRFWASPDNPTSWHTQMIFGVDFVATDNLNSLAMFLK